MSARLVLGASALLVVASLHAAPAAAQAPPTIQPLKPCYVTASTPAGPQGEPVQITAAGFTPNSRVDLTIDGQPVEGGTGLQVDATGAVTVPQFPAPFVASGSQTFTFTLTEQGNPASTVSASAKSTALGVKVRPKIAKPSDRIRFKGLGFTADEPIYAHYVHKGKLRKTVRMVRKPGECGSFKVHRRQIPIKRPGLGRWIVQFDQSKQYVDPAVAVTPIVYARLFIKLELVRR
jgi:hypothetical protein